MSRVSLITVILLSQLLNGCSEPSYEQLLSKAKQNIELGEHNEAVITLKSLLQKSPEDSEARLLLGELHVQMGAASAAFDGPRFALSSLTRTSELGQRA